MGKKADKEKAKKDYDPTVARIAGNIFGPLAVSLSVLGYPGSKSSQLVQDCARIAWELVDEVRKQTPKKAGDDE